MAAGLGTRMKPLTNNIPKALLTYQGKTLLQHIMEQLLTYGFLDIVINIHHHGDQIINFLQDHNYFNTNVTISDERDHLLDTGGGLLKVSQYFQKDPFIVHNVDIITNMDLNKLYEAHLQKSPLATLAVKERETSRSLLTDKECRLCGWRNNLTGEEIISRKSRNLYPIAFSGIYVLDPQIFAHISKKGTFPIMPELLNIARTHEIKLFQHNESQLKDMGKPESYQ